MTASATPPLPSVTAAQTLLAFGRTREELSGEGRHHQPGEGVGHAALLGAMRVLLPLAHDALLAVRLSPLVAKVEKHSAAAAAAALPGPPERSHVRGFVALEQASPFEPAPRHNPYAPRLRWVSSRVELRDGSASPPHSYELDGVFECFFPLPASRERQLYDAVGAPLLQVPRPLDDVPAHAAPPLRAAAPLRAAPPCVMRPHRVLRLRVAHLRAHLPSYEATLVPSARARRNGTVRST